MRRKQANRRPYWLKRASLAFESGAEGVATQYDLARTQIKKIPRLGKRDEQWEALRITINAFTARRFVGGPVPPPAGRMAEAERSFKAQHSPIDAAAAAYDTARKFLRRIDYGTQQEALWRELESDLRRFNERFNRDRTRLTA